MNVIRTRLHIAEDGSITGHAPALPPGDHEADIAVLPAASVPTASETDLWAGIRALQEEVARLPVLDSRSPEEILGYNVRGTFD
jgi:hypothetical protein